MKYLLLILSIAILNSCSLEHRATQAIKRIGAKPMLKSLVLDYPELFNNHDSLIYVNVHDTVRIEIPVKDYDTLLIDQPCQALNYEDKNVLINYDNGHLYYEVKKHKASMIYDKKEPVINPCPPCPIVQIAQDIKNDYIKKSQPTQLEVIYKWWFWFSWLIITLIVIFFVAKRLVKPV